ncbi:MAG: hypothetical protein ACKOPM_16385 [Novosphingobium sp.]
MFAIELSVLLTLGGIFAVATLVRSLRTALPQIAGLRQALKDCPETSQLRFTVREIVVSYNDGKVIPLRRRQTVSLPRQQTVRAAA